MATSLACDPTYPAASSRVDFDLWDLLTAPSPRPKLRCLQLNSYSRLRGDATDEYDACKTTVRQLVSCKDFRVAVVFDTWLIRVDHRESLFDSFDLSALSRLIWLPKEWLIQRDGDDDVMRAKMIRPGGACFICFEAVGGDVGWHGQRGTHGVLSVYGEGPRP